MTTPSRRLARPTILLAVAALLATALPALADPGDVDTTFGTAGLATVVENGVDTDPAIVKRKGGLALASTDGADAVIYGLTAGGDPDPSFGANGVRRLAIPNASDLSSYQAVIDADGRILMVGEADGDRDRVFVVRVKPNGAIDKSFSKDGIAIVTFPSADAYGYGIATRKNNVLITGEVYHQDAPGSSLVGVAALKESGALNKDFGNKGRKTFDPSPSDDDYDGGWRIIPGPNGTWLVAGWAGEPATNNYDTFLARLKSNGGMDNSFGDDGVRIYDLGTSDYAYGLTADGTKLVLSVEIQPGNPMVLRLKQNGGPDNSFSGDGEYSFPSDFQPQGAVVDSSGRILVAERNTAGLAVRRVNENGTTDTGFGTNGRAVSPTAAIGWDVMLQSGKPIVSGGTTNQVNAARYLGA